MLFYQFLTSSFSSFTCANWWDPFFWDNVSFSFSDLRFQAILSSAEWKLQERLNDGKPPSGALRIPRASKLIKGSAAPLQTVSALSQRSSPCQNGPKDPFTPLNTSSYSGLTMQPLRPGDITT
ncbi:hypothetical protein NECAME_03228, partial [Necator americanus]